MRKKFFLDLLHRRLFPKLFLHRGDLRPGQAAGNDPFEKGEIGVHVERQAVAGDPPSNSDADSGDLSFPDPYPGPRRLSPGLEAVVGERSDQCPLDLAQIAVYIPSQSGAEIQQRINHHLARAMIGRISAAAGAVDRNISRAEQAGFFSASSDGEDVRMLDQQNNVRQSLSLLHLHQVFLERERGAVFHPPQIFKKQRLHHLLRARVWVGKP